MFGFIAATPILPKERFDFGIPNLDLALQDDGPTVERRVFRIPIVPAQVRGSFMFNIFKVLFAGMTSGAAASLVPCAAFAFHSSRQRKHN